MEMLVPMILSGLKTTLGVFFITLIFSIPLSILVANLRISKSKILSVPMAIYIYIMRGTPLLLQLMFIFFGLPLIGSGISLDRYTAIFVAFILNYTAYFAEIFRAGIKSIDIGQYEGAKVLGLSKFYSFRKIILPQVIRNILPALSNEVITLIKDTSLVYILGASDVLKAAKAVSNRFTTFTPYIIVGIVYLVLVAIISKLLKSYEKSFDYFR